MPDGWEVLQSRTALHNPWITVRQETVRLPGGLVIEDYNIVEQPEFVSIVAVTASDDVVFVRQYKHGVREQTLEIPAGFVDDGEDPEAAAHRELREETGYEGKLQLVTTYIVNPTREATREYVFFGRVSKAGAQQLDPAEDIAVELIPARDVPSLIRHGRIRVLSTVACCLFCLPLITSGG